MDTSEYLGMFLAESREHLQTLNLAVIRLEGQPDDAATIDEIFRIAHSLKGMSGTMGFAQMAALTHEMEDVFETLRGRTEPIERRVVDVLLLCLDALESAVDAIERTGSEQLEAAALVERLHQLVSDPAGPPVAPAGSREAPAVPPAAVDDRPLLLVEAALLEDTMMPAVRAYMVLAALGDLGVVAGSSPAAADVDEFSGRSVTAWLATDHEPEAVRAAVAAIPDVGSVTCAAAERSAAPVSTPAAAEAAAAPAPAVHAATAPAGGGRRTAATVRVDAERLDQLMHFMGELVVHRTRVESIAAGSGVTGLNEAVADMTRSSQALQAMVMQVRMIEVDAVFMRFPRLVRDLSGKLGKRVELVVNGRETELDRTVVDALGDPLVHLVRNALDHALETPGERREAGKPETGTIELSARHAGGNVVIAVRDDGRGIDPARVAAKAAERGLIEADAVASVDMPRAIALLFAPGFSTAEQTSDISGRGVGMDAVRAAIKSLGGAVEMTSEQGAGTTVQIRLPLTLAIMPALLVAAADQPYAVPLDRVERTLNLAEQTVRSVTGRPMLVLADGVLPLLDLNGTLSGGGGAHGGFAVIARSGERRLALAVDRLVGQYELVTRPLPAELGSRAALSGGAVLSDGEIALIVDCDAIAAGAARPPVERSIAA